MMQRVRDERGAVAVMVAVLAMVLFMAGAVAVDMGQVYAKRSALQSNVDMAVMAAAAELTQEDGCNAEVVAKAEEYLVKATNEVADQVPVNLSTGDAGDDEDGSIRCQDWRVDLWAPRVEVNFGLAKAMSPSNEGLQVPATAAAEFKSPSQSAALPMYAVAGCDYGARTISDPPPGPPPAAAPPAFVPAGTVQIRNITVSPPDAPDNAVAPYPVTVSGQVRAVPAGTTGQVVLNDSTGAQETPIGPIVTLPTGPGWNNFSISVPTVPQTILDQTGIWWVRIKVVAPTGPVDYSPTNEAEPFTVGELLFCDGVVSGNFGTLKIARSTGTPATWLEMNMILGPEPLLAINPSPGPECDPPDSEHAPVSPTDCVGTDPGFPNEAATDGLIGGSGGEPGRLDVDTMDPCSRYGDNSRTGVTPGPIGRPINDDMMSCFLTGSHSIADAVAGVPGSLSADIMKSPRFFQIPVLPVEAANGSSNAYPIVDFRAGFITDQSLSATRAAPGSVTTWNGVYFQSGHVKQLNVVLFDEAALPETAPPVGGEVDYTGSGIKILALVK